MEVAKNQSLTTHNGKEAYECCMIISYIIIKCINNEEKKLIDVKKLLDKILDYDIISLYCKDLEYSVQMLVKSQKEAEKKFHEFIDSGKYSKAFNKGVEDRDWNWKSRNFKYSPFRSKLQPGYIGSYCMDALAMALFCVYHSKSPKEAILRAVNLGGDADSVAAVVGQIAGSIWGLDKDLLELYNQVKKFDKGKCAIIAYLLYHKN